LIWPNLRNCRKTDSLLKSANRQFLFHSRKPGHNSTNKLSDIRISSFFTIARSIV